MKATINKISTDLGIATYGTFEKRMEKAVEAQLAFDEAEKESKALNTKIKTLRDSIAIHPKTTNEDKIKLEKEQKELATLEKSVRTVEKNLDTKINSKNKALTASKAGLAAFLKDYPGRSIGAESLHQAAIIGDRDLFAEVQLAGIDINAQNKEGLTPLHCALQHGRIGLADHLIDTGASLEIKDLAGLTPMDHIMKGKNDKFLYTAMGKMASPVTDDNQWTMGRYFNSAVQNGNKEFAGNILLNLSTASILYSLKGQTSALHIAAKNGDADMVGFIIQHNSTLGPQYNKFPYDTQESPQLQQDAQGNTALHEAVNGGKGEIVELLLNAIADQGQKKAYLEAANNDGKAAIDIAAEQGNRAVYEALEKAYGEAFVQTPECTNLRTQLETAEKKKQEAAKIAEQERMKQAALNAAPSLGGGGNQASQQSNGQSQSQFDPSKPVWREKMQPDGKAIIGDTTQGHFVQSRNEQGKFDYVMTNAANDSNRYVLKIPSKPTGEFDEIVYQNGQIVDVKSEAKNSQLSDNMKKQIEEYKSRLTGVSVAIDKSPTPQLQARANANAGNAISAVSNPVEQGQNQRLVGELKNKIETNLQSRGALTPQQASQPAPPPRQNNSTTPEVEAPAPQANVIKDSAGRIRQTISVDANKTKTVWETPEQTAARESAAKMQKGLTDQATTSTPTSYEQQRKKTQDLIRPQERS